MLLGPLVPKALLAAGLVLTVAEAPAAPNDRGSLYFAVSGVLVSIVSAYGLVISSRNKREPTSSPFLVDDTLTDELTGLYADAERRAAQAEMAAEMWKARAISKGWAEDET